MTFHKTGLLAICIVVTTLACWLAFGRSPPEPASSQSGRSQEQRGGADLTKFHAHREEARKLLQEQEWCAARSRWQDAADSLPPPAEADDEQVRIARDEAERNLLMLKDRCPDAKVPAPVTETAVALREEARPAEIPQKDLLDYYPVGRTVRGMADLDMTGRGSNERWFLTADSHFAYRYEVVVETRVKEHRKRGLDRKAVVFEQRFLKVTQLRAVSEVELQLRLPESPILNVIWSEIEQNVLIHVPAYHVLRRAADIVRLADPGLKKTLTRFADELGLSSTEDAELATQVESLSGMSFEMEYDNGRGVTYIRVIQGPPLDREALDQIAAGSSLLLDYFVFPAVKEKQEGDEWTVRAEDVAGLFPVGYDVRARGEITLRRGRNEKPPDGPEVAILDVVGGEVEMERIQRGGAQRASARPQKGTVWYDPRSLIVRKAVAAWSGTTGWESRDHLLFGTRNVRNLRVETYYEADRADGPVEP